MGRVKDGAEDIISSSHCRRQHADETKKDKREKSQAVNLLPFFYLTKNPRVLAQLQWDPKCIHDGITRGQLCEDTNTSNLQQERETRCLLTVILGSFDFQAHLSAGSWEWLKVF